MRRAVEEPGDGAAGDGELYR